MRCCVKSCKNDSRTISKSHGITFHVFPTESKMRQAWLKAIGKESWSPRERSAVCSDHFMIEDIFVTKSGLRKVRNGAVPISDSSVCSYNENTVNLLVCRICLGSDVKLLPIGKFSLEQTYEHVTGHAMSKGDNLPQYICFECAQRLANCHMFKSKCLKSRRLLLDLIADNSIISIDSIKSIDRQTHKLTSDLAITILDPDKIVNLEYVENINKIEIENIPEQDKNDIFVQELPKDFDDDFNDRDDFNDNHFNDADNVNDKDYDKCDKDYSSDDSLPLELQRKKRKKTKKVKKVDEPKIDRRRKPFLNADLNETLFTITDLTVEEQMAEIEKRQESANYKNAVFKCGECFKGFLDEDAYNGHMTRHTNECGEHECAICKTHFKHPHALRKHITAHHTQRYNCNRCPYVTTHRQTARLHERWHKGTKYQCPHCQDEFVKFTTYMGHIRIKHPSDFICVLCGYSFVSEKGIELHKKLKHRLDDGKMPDDGPLCELCNVRFVSAEAYKRHLSVSARHTNDSKDKSRKGRKTREKIEKNDIFDRKKNYPSQLRKAEGPIPCEQCGVELEDSRAYHSHFRRQHPDKNRTNYPSMKSPCMCEVCGRMFQSYALLKDHRWVHTGERPFACSICGKSFRMKQRLVAHGRVHSELRASYTCAMCGKSFSTHSNCQRHMFIHTGLRPYKCEMCGKCFKHASEKRAHITYVHLKKPWPKRSRGKRTGKGPLDSGDMAGEMESQVWPTPCDPKILDVNPLIDKSMYYNHKM
ncbi:unnamed protein product [Pieris macdunnoughi]|uniref:Uncharacterized protein n=1 Tax=Pieris macdunnoughi TaxID=345717 RepID=A0A821XH89_9NEOP|nr:unnamed protein product [Pieris macdunnoughi]